MTINFERADEKRVSVLITAPHAFAIDAANGTLHSGLATLILDTVMGGGVMAKLEVLQPIATAGLTTQHMRRPIAGEQLRCEACFEGMHEDIAHMSGRLTSAESSEILATATGTFMTGTRSKPLGIRV